ncbi:MAG: helix-turn-helix domain-containing protein [Kiritimatiellae bacterium]|nr:helix-turn-helix domain-containing protein [Kiritimatiellia bacterium]
MESIGQQLKAARERRQISISDVAAATKMTSTFVCAIEADNFGALVAPVYARGFIKLYAECVGMDPMPLLKQFGLASRAAPLQSPPPALQRTAQVSSKSMPVKAPAAHAGKQNPTRLQPSDPMPRHGATSKPAPIYRPPLSRSESPPAGRLAALNRAFIARIRWPRFKLPGRRACNAECPSAILRAAMWARSTAGRIFQYLALPVMVWRRIFIVAGVALLIIAAGLAWEWSSRSMPSMTDACRWLAEPPAPYLTVETRTPPPGR